MDSTSPQQQGQTLPDRSREHRQNKMLIAFLGVLLAGLIAASFIMTSRILDQQSFNQSALMTRLGAAKDIEMRNWMATFGGVYVPVTDATPPNPYLSPKGREITTPDGQLLTKMNPAYVTRLLHERWSEKFGMVGHITSLKPVRPANMAAPWEKTVLEELIRTGKNEYVDQVRENGVTYTRYMVTLTAQPGCLTCHTTQGYKVGDVMGGISNKVPTQEASFEHANLKHMLLWGHLVVGLLVLIVILWGGRGLLRRGTERDKAEASLHQLASTLEERIRQRTEELEALTEHTQHILASTLEGIVEVDPSGVILFINKAGQEMSGYAVGDMLAPAFLENDQLHDLLLTPAGNGRNAERTRFTGVSMRCADGQTIFVDGSTAPMLKNGVRIGSIMVFHNISEYSRVESLQRLIFDVSTEPFLIFTGRSLTNCNAAAVRFLGAKSERELCENFMAFSPPRQAGGRFSSELINDYFDLCDEQGYASLTWVHMHSNGTLMPCRVTVSRISHTLHQGYFVTLFDMRATLEYEEKLTADRRLLGDIVNASPMPMYIVDAEGRVSVTNPAGNDLLGLAEGMEGDTPWEDKKSYFSLLDVVRNEGLVNGCACRLRSAKPGEFLETRVNVAGVTYDNHRAFLIWIQNVSDLVAAKELAEDASKAKGQFLARMSHEIRTPMNAILGMTYLFLQNPLEDWQKRYITKIQVASKGLLGIINDILDFSKIEAGKMTLEIAPFSLSELVENLSNVCSAMAEEKKLELLFYMEPDLPDYYEGDALRITQVLTNLLGNAVKFTEQGEVVLRIREMGRQGGDITLFVEVSDSGIGMSREQMSRLFQSFEQADVSTTRKYGGTGLGLVICDQLVRMMGGEISVSSVLGRGSTFSFSLRLKQHESPQAFNYRNLAGNERILVVDDNEVAREVLQDMISGFGFTVDTASSGYEGCAAVFRKANEGEPYSLVMLDWKMPGMDGFECASQINNLPISTPPQLLMISAHGMEEYNTRGKNLGFLDYMAKPVTRSSLWNALAKVLGKELLTQQNGKMRQIQQELNLSALRGAKILLVEDNETNQEVAGQLLTRCGLDVTVASNGLEAVNICKLQSFDLIFMDIQMPVMDGLEATRNIRNNEGKDNLPVPIVAMTAHAMQSDRDKSLQAGMNDHITKPIDPETLTRVLLKWVRPRSEEELAARREAPAVAPEKPVSGVPQVIAGLPGMDAPRGLHNVGDDLASYISHLKRFPARYGAFAAQIEEQAAAGIWEDATRTAHTLKGVAATLGMTAIAECSSKLEDRGRDKLLDAGQLAELRGLIESMCAAIEQAFAEDQGAAGDAGGGDAKGLTNLLKSLPGMLHRDVGKCMNMATELKVHVPSSLTEEEYQKVYNGVYEFDEEALRQAVDAVLARLEK